MNTTNPSMNSTSEKKGKSGIIIAIVIVLVIIIALVMSQKSDTVVAPTNDGGTATTETQIGTDAEISTELDSSSDDLSGIEADLNGVDFDNLSNVQ